MTTATTTSVVHVLSGWEPAPGGVSLRRCSNCREIQFLRFPGDAEPWHHEGDRIRVHGGGQRERTDGAVTCLRAA